MPGTRPPCRPAAGCRARDVRSLLLCPFQMRQQTIEEHLLVWVEQLPCSVQRHKARLVHFPRCRPRSGVGRGWPGETVHALAALFVFHVAQRHQRASDDAGLFQRLAASRLLQVGARWLSHIRHALGNAPGSTAVVVAGWVHQQDLQSGRTMAVEQRARRLLHVFTITRREASANEDRRKKKTHPWAAGGLWAGWAGFFKTPPNDPKS